MVRPGPDKTDDEDRICIGYFDPSGHVDSFMKLMVSNLRSMVPSMTIPVTCIMLTHVQVMQTSLPQMPKQKTLPKCVLVANGNGRKGNVSVFCQAYLRLDRPAHVFSNKALTLVNHNRRTDQYDHDP